MTPDVLMDRMVRRSRRLPLLDLEYYHATAHIGDQEPLDHFARRGVWERRTVIEARRRQARLAELCATAPAPRGLAREVTAHALRHAPDMRVRIVEPPDAAPRSREAAAWLAAALREAGAQVGAGGGEERVVWVDPVRRPVDPAEDPEQKARLARAVVLLTGSPTDKVFDEHLPMAMLSAGVMSFAPETHAAFSATGMPAAWLAPPEAELPLDPPAAWRAVVPMEAPADDWTARPYDYAAFGFLTDRRIQAWIAMGRPLSKRRGFVHMPRSRDGRQAGYDAELSRYVYARSRVALHLQPEHAGALPWQTICGGAARLGAVVVSEPGLAHPLLTAGVHFFEEAPRRIPALLDWLLDTHDGRLEAERKRLAARSALLRADDLFEAGVRAASFLLALREEGA